MKFSLTWLRDHLDVPADLTLARLEEVMTMAGLEVEEIHDPAATLAGITVAKVREAAQHPDADKLQVCQVDTVDGPKEIVCGALNARAGLSVAYAPLGTFIPGWGEALGDKAKAIRGVKSHGMLCSEGELECDDDPLGLRAAREVDWLVRAEALGIDPDKARADGGIVELPDDAAIGASVAEVLGLEAVVDFEVTPNRPDWLGVVGIARDLGAAGLGTFTEPTYPPVAGSFDSPVPVKITAPEACPVFATRLIRGVRPGTASPAWMQERLRAVGIQPKTLLVDVTNYVSLDAARPLHVFDAAKLTGDVTIRLGQEGEELVGLDEKTYPAGPDTVVIADDTGVISLGGMMGGASTGCDEATVDVLLESAWFEPNRIARTGRALGITSDAQYRFARGVDPASTLPGIERATALILKYAGGDASHVHVAGAVPPPPGAIAFHPSEVRRLTGLETSAEEIIAVLTRLGFTIKTGKTAKAAWSVTPPSWRADCTLPADLVEEVARIVGYDALPETRLPALPGRRGPAVAPGQRRVMQARRAAVTRGLNEAITWSFCRHDQAALFGGEDPALRLANPISSELDVMRPSALVHLALAAQKSADRGFPDAALVEVGPIYGGTAASDQETVAAGVRRVALSRHWDGHREPTVFDAKADALAILEAAGAPIESTQVSAPARAWWHPGRSGVIQLGPKAVLAEFGELHPGVLKALGVDGRLVAFEVFLDRIPAPRASKGGAAKPAFTPSDLMPLTRDFAFVVDSETAAGAVVKAVQGADKALITGVDIFDVFAGEALGADKKSLAVAVTLQPRDQTLDDAAIEAVAQKIVAAVKKATGGVLRA